MNLKKFVSSISAFAVAASTFAGMAVTASAADAVNLYNVDYTDSATWATGSTDGWTQTSGSFSATIGTTEDGLSITAGTANGKYRDYEATKALDATGFSGNLQISALFNTGTSQSNTAGIKFTDASGNVILNLTSDRTNTKFLINDVEYTTISSQSPTSAGYTTQYLRDYILNAVTWEINANIDTETHSGTVSIIRNMDATHTYYLAYNEPFTYATTTGALSKAVIYRTGANYATSNTYYPQILKSLTISKLPEAAGALTINYVDADGNPIKAALNADVSTNYVGDTYSYSYPKYIEKDRTLYKAVSSTYTASTKLTSTAKSVDVEYAAVGTGTYQFEDFDGEANPNASNGGYLKTNASTTASFTVAENGVYKIDGAACTDGNSGRYVVIKVDGEQIFQSENLTASSTVFTAFSTTATLREGQTVTINGRDSHGGYLDYVILTKTGEIPTPAEASELTTVKAPWSSGDGTYAEAFKFTVTPNDEVVTGVKVSANGQDKAYNVGEAIQGGISAVFGIIATSASEANLPAADAFTVTLTVE